MDPSRREFVATSLAGLAALCVSDDAGTHAATGPLTPAIELPPEDGYKLWLRSAPLGGTATRYARSVTRVLVEGTSATSQVTRRELESALSQMLGAAIPADGPLADGTIVVGTPTNSSSIRGLGWGSDLAKAGAEGYVIRAARVANRTVDRDCVGRGDRRAVWRVPLPSSDADRAVDRQLDLAERPKIQLRLLNHWDNLNGTIERGYAGTVVVAVGRAARHDQSALRRLRTRERFDRHQRRRHQQRERGRPHPVAGVPRQGRGARRSRGALSASACISRPTSLRRCGSVD